MEKLVLARVLGTIGQEEKTAKSSASRMVNKAGVEKDENGFVNTSDIITLLTNAYVGDKVTSKYAEPGREILAEIVAGKFRPEWNEPVVNAPKGPTAFTLAKVAKAVKVILEDKGTITLDGFNQVVEAVLEDEAAKTEAKK